MFAFPPISGSILIAGVFVVAACAHPDFDLYNLFTTLSAFVAA